MLDGRQADGVLLVDNSPGMVHMRRLVLAMVWKGILGIGREMRLRFDIGSELMGWVWREWMDE